MCSFVASSCLRTFRKRSFNREPTNLHILHRMRRPGVADAWFEGRWSANIVTSGENSTESRKKAIGPMIFHIKYTKLTRGPISRSFHVKFSGCFLVSIHLERGLMECVKLRHKSVVWSEPIGQANPQGMIHRWVSLDTWACFPYDRQGSIAVNISGIHQVRRDECRAATLIKSGVMPKVGNNDILIPAWQCTRIRLPLSSSPCMNVIDGRKWIRASASSLSSIGIW